MPAGWAAAAGAVAGGVESYENNQAAGKAADKNNAQAQNVAQGVNTALSTAEAINNTPFTPYTAPLVAGLSGNQSQAVGLAASAPGGQASQDFNAADTQIGNVAGNTFSGDTIQKYMNPYVSDVVNNSIANANRSTLQQEAQAHTTSGQSGAFGGSAQALGDAETNEQNSLNIGNLTANGYANAYNNAINSWSQDNQRMLNAAQAYQQNGNDVTKMTGQQVQDLMETGGAQQAVSQGILSSNYGQFLRQQGWSTQQLQPLIQALGAAKGASTSVSAPPANNGLNNILGAASTVAGLWGSGAMGGSPNAASSSDPYAYDESAPTGYQWGNNGGIVPIGADSGGGPG